MRTPVHAQTEEVASGRSATSAQPPHATLVPATKVSSPHMPHPIGSSSLPDTPGALLEGLRCYPLPARSRKRRRFVGKPPLKPRNSR
jgi:hypothetical protein